MAHTYATVDEFKAYAADNGVSVMGATNDATILGLLEASSRRVDGYCGRSEHGSGFGPRTATNRYEGEGDEIELADDFISVSSVAVYLTPVDVAAAYTLTSSDFDLEPYSGPPYRCLELHGYGQLAEFPEESKVIVTGVAGYASEIPSVAATAGTLTVGATSAILTGAGVALGATLRIDSEDLYVTATTAGTALASTGGTVTVSRGANGTTAATHSAGAAVAVHTYPREVKTATLMLAMRRWRMREAGLTGDFGGSASSFGQRDSDLSILAGNVYHLKRIGVG